MKRRILITWAVVLCFAIITANLAICSEGKNKEELNTCFDSRPMLISFTEQNNISVDSDFSFGVSTLIDTIQEKKLIDSKLRQSESVILSQVTGQGCWWIFKNGIWIEVCDE